MSAQTPYLLVLSSDFRGVNSGEMTLDDRALLLAGGVDFNDIRTLSSHQEKSVGADAECRDARLESDRLRDINARFGGSD